MRDRMPGRVPEPGSEDGGFTLVEAMVGLLLITVALLALLGEVTSYLRTQGAERSQAQAVRALSTTIEDARALPADQLDDTVGTTTSGTDYRLTTVLRLCSLSDPPSQCTAPPSAAATDRRLTATVRWTYGGKERELTSSTSVADRGSTSYREPGAGTLGGLLGGADRAPLNLTVQTISASPSVVTATAAGHAQSDVTVTATTLGLSAASSLPVTWTDDTGTHQVDLTGGPTTWSARIPAASLTRAFGPGQSTSSIVLTAAVPGAAGLTQTTVTLTQRPTLTGCSIAPSPIRLGLLSGRTVVPETLTCTATGLRASDAVSVVHTSGLGTAARALTSSNGTTWTTVLPAGTALGPLGVLTTFTVTGTRDGLSSVPVQIASVLGL